MMTFIIKAKSPPPLVGPGYYVPYTPFFVWIPPIEKWCLENIGPKREEWDNRDDVFYFSNHQHATLFKLTWG